MKRIFTLLASIVLAAGLLAMPCFAAQPDAPATPQPGVTAPEQPEEPEEPGTRPCDTFPGQGDIV